MGSHIINLIGNQDVNRKKESDSDREAIIWLVTHSGNEIKYITLCSSSVNCTVVKVSSSVECMFVSQQLLTAPCTFWFLVCTECYTLSDCTGSHLLCVHAVLPLLQTVIMFLNRTW
jgi:hypothetical protein